MAEVAVTASVTKVQSQPVDYSKSDERVFLAWKLLVACCCSRTLVQGARHRQDKVNRLLLLPISQQDAWVELARLW